MPLSKEMKQWQTDRQTERERSTMGKIVSLLLVLNDPEKVDMPLNKEFSLKVSPVSWSCRMQPLHLCWGVRTNLLSYVCPGYDTKLHFIEEAPFMDLWEMLSTLSLSLIPGVLWPKLLVTVIVLSIGWVK